MGFIDTAIGFVSPTWRLNREAAKIKLDYLQRSYEGAKKNRRTVGWHTPATGANAEVLPALGIL